MSKIKNLALAYLSLPQNVRAAYRKVKKAHFNSREFQMALTEVGGEKRLDMHRNCCIQAYQTKKARVEGKIGNHKLIPDFPV